MNLKIEEVNYQGLQVEVMRWKVRVAGSFGRRRCEGRRTRN